MTKEPVRHTCGLGGIDQPPEDPGDSTVATSCAHSAASPLGSPVTSSHCLGNLEGCTVSSLAQVSPSLRQQFWKVTCPHPSSQRGFPGGASGKEPACQCRRHKRCRFDPWFRKIPWRRIMATHSSILAWRIPWTEEHGRLQPIGWRRVGHY